MKDKMIIMIVLSKGHSFLLATSKTLINKQENKLKEEKEDEINTI